MVALPTQQANLIDLVQDTHRLLQEKEQLEEQYIDVVVKIGQNLNQMKPHKPYGQFMSWVEAEFNISHRSANDYMNIAAIYQENSQRVANFPLRVVSLLAAPSTPEQIRTQVESGQIPATLPAIREAKQELQQTIEQSQPVTVTPIQPSTFFERWQKDNVALGLTEWADPLPAQSPARVEVKPQETVALSPVVPLARGVPAALLSSESNEWYTPAHYINAAREVMGDEEERPWSSLCGQGPFFCELHPGLQLVDFFIGQFCQELWPDGAAFDIMR